MVKRIVATTLVVSMLTSPAAFAGGAPGISVNAIPCASPNIQPQVAATVPDDTASARVYFRAGGSNHEYYVEMLRGANQTMTALLPMPAPETKTFTYRVVTTSRSGKEMVSSSVSTDVQAFCATGVQNAPIVLGLTSGAPAVPEGWQCRNVTHYITTAGVMLNNEECRRLLAGTAPSAGAPATTTAPSTATTPVPITPAPSAAVPGAGTGAATGAGTGAGTAAGAGAAAGAGTGAAAGAGTAGGGVFAGLSPTTIAIIAGVGLAAGWFIYDNNRDEEEVSPSRP
jgi:hypothetical protein